MPKNFWITFWQFLQNGMPQTAICANFEFKLPKIGTNLPRIVVDPLTAVDCNQHVHF